MEQIVLVSSFQASMYSFKYVNIKTIAYNIFLFFLFNLRTRIFFSFLDAKTGKKKKKRPTRILLNPNTRAARSNSTKFNHKMDRSPKLNLIRFNVIRNNIHASIKFNKIPIPLLFFLFSFFFFLPSLPFSPSFHASSSLSFSSRTKQV